MEKKYAVTITVTQKKQFNLTVDVPDEHIEENKLSILYKILKLLHKDTIIAIIVLIFFTTFLSIGLMKDIPQIIEIGILVAFLSTIASLGIEQLIKVEHRYLIILLATFAISCVLTVFTQNIIDWELVEKIFTVISFIILLMTSIVKDIKETIIVLFISQQQ